MTRHEESRPWQAGPQREAIHSECSTFTSLSGTLIRLRVDALQLGRRLELDPTRWPEAQSAFRLATSIADVTRQVAR